MQWLIALFDIQIGNLEIHFLDMIYVYSLLAIFIGLFLQWKSSVPWVIEIKIYFFLILLYLFFHFAYLLTGLIRNVPLQTCIRYFYDYAQITYAIFGIVVLKNEEQLKSLLKFCIFLTILFPFIQVFYIINIIDPVRISSAASQFRLGYGNFNVILAISFLYFITWQQRFYLASFPGFGILLLTHRSAYLSLICSSFLSFMLMKKKTKSLVSMVIIAIFIVAFLFFANRYFLPILVEQASSRIDQTFEMTNTTQGRIMSIQTTIRIVLAKHPVLGLGYNGYYEAAQIQKKSIHSDSFNIVHPHNFVLRVLNVTGLIGLAFIFLILAYIFKILYSLIKILEIKTRAVYLFVTMVFFVIYSTMNTTFFSAGYILWFLSGVAFWYKNKVVVSAAE